MKRTGSTYTRRPWRTEFRTSAGWAYWGDSGTLERAVLTAKDIGRFLEQPRRVRNIDTGEIAWTSETETKP